MKFLLTTSGKPYTQEEAEKLKEIGFKFGISQRDGSPYMMEDDVFIEINSIEELVSLSKELDSPIIVDWNEPGIEIYDNYREG